jgi:hypothetical protein
MRGKGGGLKNSNRNSNTFQVVPLGLPPIPETNNSVSLPQEHWEYVVKGDTIAFIPVEQVSGGGIGRGESPNTIFLACHPERSEGSYALGYEILRCRSE